MSIKKYKKWNRLIRNKISEKTETALSGMIFSLIGTLGATFDYYTEKLLIPDIWSYFFGYSSKKVHWYELMINPNARVYEMNSSWFLFIGLGIIFLIIAFSGYKSPKKIQDYIKEGKLKNLFKKFKIILIDDYHDWKNKTGKYASK